MDVLARRADQAGPRLAPVAPGRTGTHRLPRRAGDRRLNPPELVHARWSRFKGALWRAVTSRHCRSMTVRSSVRAILTRKGCTSGRRQAHAATDMFLPYAWARADNIDSNFSSSLQTDSIIPLAERNSGNDVDQIVATAWCYGKEGCLSGTTRNPPTLELLRGLRTEQGCEV